MPNSSALGRTGVIVAARTASTRLPGKALLPLLGVPMIVFLLRRLKPTRRAEAIVLATTTLAEDDLLAETVAAEDFSVFRGAEADLIERFVEAARRHELDTVVRVTGDCPFVDSQTLDFCLGQCEAFGRFDLASTKNAFPVGIDFEIYPAAAMTAIQGRADLTPRHREHLTLYFYDHPCAFDIRTIEPPEEWRLPGRTFTVDTEADYNAARELSDRLGRLNFSVSELVALAREARTSDEV